MNKDIIYRQAAIDALGEEPAVLNTDDDYDVATRNQWEYDVECIKEVPSADVQPVMKGKWIRNDNGTYSCSVCQSWIPEEQHCYARYCLYCGADMRGEQE